MDFVLDIAVDFDGFGRWRLSIRESVWDGGLDLRDVEDGVNESEFMRESEMNGVLANAVDDFERTEERFGELAGRLGCLYIL